MESSRVKVTVRVRPHTKLEKGHSQEELFEFIDSRTCSIGSHQFSFDQIFSPRAGQEELFYSHFNEYVDNVLDGCNSSIIAYGQTAAGKSYTMMGGPTPESEGAIPRSLRRIFENQTDAISMGFVEIYNEKVYDLLNNRNIVNMLGDGSMKDAKVESAQTLEAAIDAIKRGNALRSTSGTKMNELSSRSHALISITLKGGATLLMVDLAGSEVVKKTGASGKLLGEAGSINKSLTSLAMVVSVLASAKPNQQQHVPYRSCKLTQMLQIAFTRESKTSLVINCSPSEAHLSETISSLRFGSRCKEIKTQVVSKTERAKRAELLIWDARLDKALLPWKLGEHPPAVQWLDTERVCELLGVAKDKYHIRRKHTRAARTSARESLEELAAKSPKVIALNLKIEKLKNTLHKYRTEVEDMKSQLSSILETPVFDNLENQVTQLQKLKRDLADSQQRVDILQDQVAIARTTPNSEKIRVYLKRLYMQMDEVEHRAGACSNGQKRPLSASDPSMDKKSKIGR